jgi:hypothetical protein
MKVSRRWHRLASFVVAGGPVLEGHSVVYFGNDWYAENRTSSHHVAARLALDPAGAVRRFAGPACAAGQRARPAPRVSQNQLGAACAHARSAPICGTARCRSCRFGGFPASKRSTACSAAGRCDAACACWATQGISWFVVPHPGFLAQRLGEELCVYYCIDDYAAHPGVDTTLIAERDRELTRAPTWFCRAARPARGQARDQPEHRFSPHGVDVSLFARAMDPATEIPALRATCRIRWWATSAPSMNGSTWS